MSIGQVGHIQGPVVWTLHDMWPFCGNEHYEESSPDVGWRTGYARGPESASTDAWSRWVWRHKVRSWHQDVTFVAPTQWMANLKLRSALLPDASVEVIPNPVPLDVFAERDRVEARRLLGMNSEGTVIGFVADEGVANPLKGYSHLVLALKQLQASHPAVQLLIVGKTPPGSDHAPVPTFTTGQIRDDKRLAAAYAACDIVCVPSLLDNAPQTATEASAVGRPVVAYAAGGIPELVVDGDTGLLATVGDPGDLARALGHLIEHSEVALAMGRAGRQRALNCWEPSVVGDRYRELYQRLR